MSGINQFHSSITGNARRKETKTMIMTVKTPAPMIAKIFDDFFEVVKRTINNERSCVYHVSCNGEAISRFRLAEKILDIHKRYNLPIKRESLDSALCDDPTFPRRLVLDTGLTKKELEIDFTCIDEAIEKHILRVVKLKN